MDWEAILSDHPDRFAEEVGSWLLPPEPSFPRAPEPRSPSLSKTLFNVLQVDWEAILSDHPDRFAEEVGSWLLPQDVRWKSGAGGQGLRRRGEGREGQGREGEAAEAVGAGQGTGAGAGGRAGAASAQFPDVESLPAVSSVLRSVRQRVEALNPPVVPRI